uniref:Uncharacterized protein n=1 Tax=Daphnia galeata TaxID=27404 RepID=A0A8J2W173_9CRUS|nr:unnamed protein product [Daphnia galeata]
MRQAHAVHYEPVVFTVGPLNKLLFRTSLTPLGPFCKISLNLTLRGVTNDQTDPSIDILGVHQYQF